MDDRIDQTDGASAVRSTLGRREMLQRTGFVLGATAIWATPVVQTIGMRPAAATDTDLGGSLCPEDSGNRRPTRIVFRVEPNLELDVDFDSDRWPGGFTQTTVDDHGSSLADLDVEVLVTLSPSGAGGGNVPFTQSPPASTVLTAGDEVQIERAGMNNLDFEIRRASDTELLQSGTIHTSCSDPLICGGQYGSLQIVAGDFDGEPTFNCRSEV